MLTTRGMAGMLLSGIPDDGGQRRAVNRKVFCLLAAPLWDSHRHDKPALIRSFWNSHSASHKPLLCSIAVEAVEIFHFHLDTLGT
jgi:hypothetical protein